MTHATVAVEEGGARPVHCPFCGWELHRHKAKAKSPQVRVGYNAGERAVGGGGVAGLRQPTAHKGHSKHVWSCLVTNSTNTNDKLHLLEVPKLSAFKTGNLTKSLIPESLLESSSVVEPL